MVGLVNHAGRGECNWKETQSPDLSGGEVIEMELLPQSLTTEVTDDTQTPGWVHLIIQVTLGPATSAGVGQEVVLTHGVELGVVSWSRKENQSCSGSQSASP